MAQDNQQPVDVTPADDGGQPSAIEESERQHFSIEVIGELVLLLMVGGFFIYMFYESFEWQLGGQLIPWIAIALGTPFLIVRIFALILPPKLTGAPAQIMDIGFSTSSEPGAGWRLLRISGYIVLLYLGIWIFGFHVALPLGTFLYLYIYGKTGLAWAAGVALLFLALMIGVYDELLHAHWPKPLIVEWLGWDY
jgi:hypothetical protein